VTETWGIVGGDGAVTDGVAEEVSADEGTVMKAVEPTTIATTNVRRVALFQEGGTVTDLRRIVPLGVV
jgi:hypothetical protein